MSDLALRLLIWPVLGGTGLYLLITALPWWRPKPDLIERLARLDIERRLRADAAPTGRPYFRSRLLEALLRPMLEALGEGGRRLAARLGYRAAATTARDLRVVRPGVDLGQFHAEKVGGALLFAGLLPLMNAVGADPFGRWPVWIWLLGAVAGFYAPDWDLARRMAGRRARILAELPAILDNLTLAIAAGQSPEQALALVATPRYGLMGREFRLVRREIAVAARTLTAALGAMAERNGVPELTTLVRQLRAADEQGVPLVRALTAQAESLRERKRLRILADGNRAAVRMIVPVGLFIFPVLIVILLYPAAIQLIGLGE